MTETRVALLTGGAGSIAFATARRLAELGMRIAVVDRDRAAATAAARQLGEGHHGFSCDVSSEADVEGLFSIVEHRMGPVAVLCNFAGIFPVPESGPPRVVTCGVDEWDRTFAVNARGTFLMVRAMMRSRTESPVADGRIVNVSSSAAQLGGYNGSSAYAASKGAVLTFTKVAAREAASLGITVNAVAPGAIDTPLLRTGLPRERDAVYLEKVPMGRIGTVEDVAAAVAYLVSKDASYVTGACLDVNGGIRMQ